MAKVTVEIDDRELWSRVFGASPFSFGEWFTELAYDGGNWDIPCVATLWYRCEEDCECTQEHSTKVTVVKLEEALQRLSEHDGYKWVLGELANDNLDSIGADAILQQLVYGKVVFG